MVSSPRIRYVTCTGLAPRAGSFNIATGVLDKSSAAPHDQMGSLVLHVCDLLRKSNISFRIPGSESNKMAPSNSRTRSFGRYACFHRCLYFEVGSAANQAMPSRPPSLPVNRLLNRSVGQCVSQCVGQCVGQSAGQSVCRPIGQSVSVSVSVLVSVTANRPAGQCVGQSASRSASPSVRASLRESLCELASLAGSQLFFNRLCSLAIDH